MVSTRDLVLMWEATDGHCWRCGKKITAANGKTAIYGVDWVKGHAGTAKWAGGKKMLPEHVECNSTDGREQTKLAAKSIRIRAKAYGIKSARHVVPGSKASKWAKRYNRTTGRFETVLRFVLAARASVDQCKCHCWMDLPSRDCPVHGLRPIGDAQEREGTATYNQRWKSKP